MTRQDLLHKVELRKKEVGITLENLAKLSHNGVRTVHRFFAGEDVKLSTIEKITNTLGLDFAGNETLSLKELNSKRAKEKAIFLASRVQHTSALEMQGLNEEHLKKMIEKLEKTFLTGKYKDKLWIA